MSLEAEPRSGRSGNGGLLQKNKNFEKKKKDNFQGLNRETNRQKGITSECDVFVMCHIRSALIFDTDRSVSACFLFVCFLFLFHSLFRSFHKLSSVLIRRNHLMATSIVSYFDWIKFFFPKLVLCANFCLVSARLSLERHYPFTYFFSEQFRSSFRAVFFRAV